MPQTHDFGRLFVHRLRHPVDGAPRFLRAETTEVEPPYRFGQGLAIRFRGRSALVIGWWDSLNWLERPSWYPQRDWEARSEIEALYAALRAYDMDTGTKEIEAWNAPLPEDEDGNLSVCAQPQPDADGISGPPCGAAVVDEEGRPTIFY